jgi:hypothetical protein
MDFTGHNYIDQRWYLSQATTRSGKDQMARLTRDLIDLCATSGGRFFLPYQLHHTAEQLTRSYPEVRAILRSQTAVRSDRAVREYFLRAVWEMTSGVVRKMSAMDAAFTRHPRSSLVIPSPVAAGAKRAEMNG